MANALTDPPFANNPPIKFNVNAKILGLVIGILAIIGAVLALIALPALLALNNAVNTFCGSLGVNCGTTGGIFFLGLLGFIIVLVGEVLAAIGGFRMYQMNRQGKVWVIYGLALGLIGGILEVIGYSSGFIGSLIFNVIVAIVLYYLVVISRFPGESPLVASGGYGGTGYGGGYGGPGTTPPPPPPSA
jgi:hypothetical protein